MTTRLMVCLLNAKDDTPIVTGHHDVASAVKAAEQLAGGRLEWLPDGKGWFSQCSQYSYCLIQMPASEQAYTEQYNYLWSWLEDDAAELVSD